MKERILQFLDYKGIRKNKFYLETGLSNGFLDKVNDIGVSKLEQILKTYPEINPEFMIFGTEPMLRKDIKKDENDSNELFLTQKELIETQKKLIEKLEEENKELKQNKSRTSEISQ